MYIEQTNYTPISREDAEKTLGNRYPALTNAQVQRQLDAAEKVTGDTMVFIGTMVIGPTEPNGRKLFWIRDGATCQRQLIGDHGLAVTRRFDHWNSRGYQWLCADCARTNDIDTQKLHGKARDHFRFVDIFSETVNSGLTILPESRPPFRATEIPRRQSQYQLEIVDGLPRVVRFAADGNRILTMIIECQDRDAEAIFICEALNAALTNDTYFGPRHYTKEPPAFRTVESITTAVEMFNSLQVRDIIREPIINAQLVSEFGIDLDAITGAADRRQARQRIEAGLAKLCVNALQNGEEEKAAAVAKLIEILN